MHGCSTHVLVLNCRSFADSVLSEPLLSSPQFEMRYNEVDRARAVFERYVEVLPSVKAWVRYAKFELQNNDVGRARSCYERAMEALGEDGNTVCGHHSDLLTDS